MKPRTRGSQTALLSCLSALALTALTQNASAQVSAEVQSAMRANCRSDFMSHCSGVSPGGREALACLQKNVASLSPACKTAVSATISAPAHAAPARATVAPARPARATVAPARTAPPKAAEAAVAHAPTAAQQNALKSACRNDFMARCRGVKPGGKDALACLERNASRLSPACRKAVAAIAGPAAPPPAAAVAAPAMHAPTAAQQNALKANCRNDFMAHCRGVKPGGQEALACLERSAPRLSPACRGAVAAISGPAPAAAVAPPPVEEAAPSGGTAFVPGAGLILKACARDLVMHCRGIAGHGKAVACLKAYEAGGHRLGIRCRAALKITSNLR